MNRFFSFLLLLVISVALFHCKPRKLDPAEQDLGFDYYPIQEGWYGIYDVDVTRIDVQGIENEYYQVKEVIKDSLMLFGEISYRLERYYRASETQNWPQQPDSVWTVRINNLSQLVRAENNRRYIKLIFPVEEGKKWDGNALNVLNEEIYTMQKVNKPLQIGESFFPKTLQVLQRADSSLVFKHRKEEFFGKGIGLVYKKIERIDYRNDGSGLGSDTTEGLLYYQKLREYGMEH